MASNMVMTTQSFFEEINHSDIEKICVLGEGSFGIVHKALWKTQYVAVKYIDQEQNGFTKEVDQLSRVNHPNIVRLYGVYNEEPYICLVMEFADGGSLYNLLHYSPRIKYTTGHAMSWVKQCADGVNHLHTMKPRPVVHRDLKSQNLLLVKRSTVIKICDFGTATEQKTLMTMNNGTIAFMAPEVFQGNKYTEKCDVFSWGIIVWEVFSRQIPFKEVQSPYAIMYSVGQGNRPSLEKIKECPEPIQNLITTCWDQNPGDRPTISNVVKKMLELCKFFPGGEIPLATEDPFVEEINNHEIHKLSFVGKGTFGTVYKAMWKNKLFAVKYIKEVDQWYQISHPNIVRLYGACTQKPNTCIVMEFCENSSLYNLLYGKAEIIYSIGHAVSWMKQCAEAIKFLHSMIPRPLIHGCLKPQNLLLVNNGTVLKIQMGSLKTDQNLPITMTKTISTEDTVHYIAPEVSEGSEYSEKSDVYSWGAIFWKVLFKGDIMSVGRENHPPLIEEYFDRIINLVNTCWYDNPADRPTMSDVIKQIVQLYTSFSGGDIPLAIQDPFVEEIDHREINKFSLAGKGTFGRVLKAVWKNKDVAVKYIKQNVPVTQISHPHIVQLYGMCTEKPNVCLVMEFCEGISLYDLLFSKPQIQYTNDHAMSWMKQCAEAVVYLHSMIPRPIIHWETQNLLLVNNGTALKICKIYPAPEVFQENKYTAKCDVYSWGFLLKVLLYRPQSVDFMHFAGRANLTEPIEQLINTCCHPNLVNRPTMHVVVQEMLDLYKSHPGGDIPLFIPNTLVREIDHRKIKIAILGGKGTSGISYNVEWKDQYIAGRCNKQGENAYNIEFRSLTWISYPSMTRQRSKVPIIDRTSYMPDNFEEFINFLIAKDCKITDDNGIDLLKLAIKFQVVRLENEVLNSLNSVAWGLKLFEFCVMEKYQIVRRHCFDWVARNYFNCLKNKYFLSLHLEAVTALLTFNRVDKVGYEIDVFKAMLNWIYSYSEANQLTLLEKRKLFDGLVKNIRFSTMTTKDCVECLQHCPVELNPKNKFIITLGDMTPRKQYLFPYAWRRGMGYREHLTNLFVFKDVILCGLKIGIKKYQTGYQTGYQIKIFSKNVQLNQCPVLEIEGNSSKDLDYVIIVLDSVVLRSKFEYTISIKYLDNTHMSVLCRKHAFPVEIDSKYQNTVIVNRSSSNMLEMMFASP